MKSESSIIDDCCCRTSNKNVLVVNVFREMMQLKTRLSEIKQNPVMKEFLEDPDNQTTFYKAIEQPTEKNLDALDEKFKTFYRINRIIRYLSGFIRRYPIDYDKRVKRRHARYQLIINKPLSHTNDESQNEIGDLISDDRSIDPLEQLISTEQSIFPISNESLNKAVKQLSPKQAKILQLYYEKGFSNKAIGLFFGQTEQNISYWHKKTLKQLKETLGNTRRELNEASTQRGGD